MIARDIFRNAEAVATKRNLLDAHDKYVEQIVSTLPATLAWASRRTAITIYGQARTDKERRDAKAALEKAAVHHGHSTKVDAILNQIDRERRKISQDIGKGFPERNSRRKRRRAAASHHA